MPKKYTRHVKWMDEFEGVKSEPVFKLMTEVEFKTENASIERWNSTSRPSERERQWEEVM